MYLVMWVFMYNLLSGICLSMFFVGALSHTLQFFRPLEWTLTMESMHSKEPNSMGSLALKSGSVKCLFKKKLKKIFFNILLFYFFIFTILKEKKIRLNILLIF